MRLRTASLLAVIALFGSACATEGLAFIQDRRVEIVAPDYRELLPLPVRIDWEVTDENLADRVGTDISFGVYVDIDPQPPGEPLEYFARDDRQCQESPSCPDDKYLRRLGVHTSNETEMTFGSLPIGPGVDLERGDPDFHEVTIVLLDEDGVRIGESAWASIFEVDRKVGG